MRLDTYKANRLVPQGVSISESNLLFSFPKLKWVENKLGDIGKFAQLTKEDWDNFDFTGPDCQEAFDYLLAMQKDELSDIADYAGINSDAAKEIRQGLLNGLSLNDRKTYNGSLDAEGLDFSSVDLRCEDWRGKLSNMTGEQWLAAASSVSEGSSNYKAGAMFTIFPDGIDLTGIDLSGKLINLSYSYVGNINITEAQMKAGAFYGSCVGTIFSNEQFSKWKVASWAKNVAFVGVVGGKDDITEAEFKTKAKEYFQEMWEANSGECKYNETTKVNDPNTKYGVVRPSNGNFGSNQ